MNKPQKELLIELLDKWDTERKTSYAQQTLRNLIVGALCMALQTGIIDSEELLQLREKYEITY